MTITNGYGTLAAFKTRFGIEGTDANRDAVIESIIQGVSRSIDGYCNRAFFAGSAGVARVFTALDPTLVFIDDIITITAVKTDENGDGTFDITWGASDYKAMPLNLTPKTWLEINKTAGTHEFPEETGAIEITGTWGYGSTTPDPVAEACYLQSNRIYQRQFAPFGIVGSAEMGQAVAIAGFDPDVEFMLQPYRRVI
jgi:hypothetical protein